MWVRGMISRGAHPEKVLQGIRSAKQYAEDLGFGEVLPGKELLILEDIVESLSGVRNPKVIIPQYKYVAKRVEMIKWYMTARSKEMEPDFMKLRGL
jgi:hypothetical protein